MTQEKPVTTAQTSSSSAQSFKQAREDRNKVLPLELKPGLVVLVQRPSIKSIIASGNVPDGVAGTILNMKPNKDGTAKVQPSDLKDLIVFQKAVARMSVVSPKIVDEPDYDKDEISLDDLDDEDIDKIFAHLTEGGSVAANSFRNDE